MSVCLSDLNRLVKAQRREHAQLTRSSSLLDLSTSRKDPRAAGTRTPTAVAKPVPDSQLGQATGVGSGVSADGFSRRQHRASLDVARSRRLPRMSIVKDATGRIVGCMGR